jgi:hypothetical protein
MTKNFGVTKEPLRTQILSLLMDLKPHHWSELHRIGGVRYGARVLELRRLGYQVETRELDDGGKSYRLLSGFKTGVPQPKRVRVFLNPADVANMLRTDGVPPRAREQLAASYHTFLYNKDKL